MKKNALIGFLVLTSHFCFAAGTAETLFSSLNESLKNNDWKQVKESAQLLADQYTESPFSKEARFFLGTALFHQGALNKANQEFSTYIQQQKNPKYFEEAMTYKFEIAEKYRLGQKKAMMGLAYMPKIASGYEDAVTIYDEIIHSMPHHELAVKSLFAKGQLTEIIDDKDVAIDVFKQLIKQFPQNDLAIESYLQIARIYAAKAKARNFDPALLSLAEINYNQFRETFPGEERVKYVENTLAKIQDKYAQGFYETGRFFERTRRVDAAKIYYNKIISVFSHSKFAKLSKQRLERMEK
ncbi:MAG TPA: tetratricopeptide repeat protein [Chlamydiales bacterium]|nr:tetratricopeptide repeat protein [Chlamydiales bacterium]